MANVTSILEAYFEIGERESNKHLIPLDDLFSEGMVSHDLGNKLKEEHIPLLKSKKYIGRIEVQPVDIFFRMRFNTAIPLREHFDLFPNKKVNYIIGPESLLLDEKTGYIDIAVKNFVYRIHLAPEPS